MNTSDNHYKHAINTEGDHPEPKLLNGSNLSFDKIRESTRNDSDGSNELIKNIDNLKITETDMNFEYFANKEKMVQDDDVKFFDKRTYGVSNSGGEHPSKHDDINSYMKNDTNTDNNTENIYNTQSNNYGPSFGNDNGNNQYSNSGGSRESRESRESKYSENEEENEEEKLLAKLDMLRKLGELTT